MSITDRLARVWSRIAAAIITTDPTPEPSNLDRMDGLR